MPGKSRQNRERADRHDGHEPQARGARGAPGHPREGEERERREDGRREVHHVDERLEHDEREQVEREAARGRGREQHDHRKVVEQGVLRRARAELPRYPARGDEAPCRDESREVRPRPPPCDPVERARAQRDAGEEKQVQRQRRVAGGEERGRIVRERAESRLAVEERVRRGMIDVGGGQGEWRRRQRVGLPAENPRGVERVEGEVGAWQVGAE